MTIYDYDNDFAHYECNVIENWCPKKTEKEHNLEGFAKFF